MKYTWWKNGDWNALCDVCGFKYKSSELKLRWDGLMVCNKDWELRHPQDLIRPLPPEKAPNWTRPDVGINQDRYVSEVCTAEGIQGVAGYGTANCARANFDLGYR